MNPNSLFSLTDWLNWAHWELLINWSKPSDLFARQMVVLSVGIQTRFQDPLGGAVAVVVVTQRLSLSLQMSSYKRATLEEEEVSDAPAEAASSPDRVEVSERIICTQLRSLYTNTTSCTLVVVVMRSWGGADRKN